MRPTRSMWMAAVALVASACVAVAVPVAVAHRDPGRSSHPGKVRHGPKGPRLAPVPEIQRLDLSGLVIDAAYEKGRNAGNTFEQTYGAATVQGVPIAGPYVGVHFDPAAYVALKISPTQIYVTWQDPAFNLIDVFVMDFKRHLIYDYAPGGAQPESIGRLTVVDPGPTHYR